MRCCVVRVWSLWCADEILGWVQLHPASFRDTSTLPLSCLAMKLKKKTKWKKNKKKNMDDPNRESITTSTWLLGVGTWEVSLFFFLFFWSLSLVQVGFFFARLTATPTPIIGHVHALIFIVSRAFLCVCATPNVYFCVCGWMY